MFVSEQDKRLNGILDMIGRIAALDFSKSLPTSDQHDMFDAIALGLNMLSEELSANVVEKAKLDLVNSKLEKFAYTTAHDLKSPINSITGLLALLEANINPEEKSDAFLYISKLKTVTEQMKSLVEGILAYSRAGALEIEKEKLDLNTVIKEIAETEAADAEIQILNQLPVIHFNRLALYQVVRNLVGNAVKYCDKNICKIVVQMEERDVEYQIKISDNGPGIARENQELIFRLFNKVDIKGKVDSHGIGLATVKRILEDSGGKIWVESVLGKGATFYFTLKKEHAEEK